MGYKITTLVENCVYGRKLQAEHGLSLYIETQEHRLSEECAAYADTADSRDSHYIYSSRIHILTG